MISDERFGQDPPATTVFPGLLARDPAMLSVLSEAASLAATDLDILIVGESGVGKELLAHGMHQLSQRKVGPFVAVNVAAIPESMVESELFGHERGAFTGAVARRVGRFEQANGGTLFLDEIGHFLRPFQPKLLRALQDKAFYRLGGERLIHSRVTVFAAADRNLIHQINQGAFEKSLYFRFHAILEVPPLRSRRADIPPLAAHFLEFFSVKYGRSLASISHRALEHLIRHSWPGNVRQLIHVIEASVVNADPAQEMFRLRSLKRSLFFGEGVAMADGGNDWMDGRTLEEIDKVAIERRLELCRGNRTRTAKSLGITRETLRTKIKKYSIDSPGTKTTA